MLNCNLCGYSTPQARDEDLGSIRGNTQKYLDAYFSLWRCPNCQTIHSLDPVDFTEIYADYPLNRARPLDDYARRTMGHLLRRLTQAGLDKSANILDYGCGGGLFVEFLRQRGYSKAEGFDPFVVQFNRPPTTRYDLVVLNDVLEHVQDPGALLDEVARYVRPGGLLYAGTADSAGVKSMKHLEKHALRLHQPFHRTLFTQEKFRELGHSRGFSELKVYTRSYMDTFHPFGNYRFLDEFSAALGYNMDLALKPESAAIVGKSPRLLFFGLFGYFFPSAIEPAVLWRVPTATP